MLHLQLYHKKLKIRRQIKYHVCLRRSEAGWWGSWDGKHNDRHLVTTKEGSSAKKEKRQQNQ